MFGRSDSFGRLVGLPRFLLPILIAVAYVGGSHMLSQSYVSAEAALAIDAPFVYRLLIPFALGLVFSPEILDSFTLRFFVAAISAFAILELLPIYLKRVMPGWLADGDQGVVKFCGVAVLVAHYVLPHRFHFYYIYDLPAIAFYQVLFLCLVGDFRVRWVGVILLTAVFSLNRETVVVAVLHAFVINWSGCSSGWRQKFNLVGQGAVLMLVVVLVRLVIMSLIEAPRGEVAEYMDGQEIRLIANFHRVVGQFQHTVAVLYFGCGMLIWLPFVWSNFAVSLKRLFLWSLLPLTLLFVVGNPTELRIFNEFVPLLSAGLTVFVTSRFPKNWLKYIGRR